MLDKSMMVLDKLHCIVSGNIKLNKPRKSDCLIENKLTWSLVATLGKLWLFWRRNLMGVIDKSHKVGLVII